MAWTLEYNLDLDKAGNRTSVTDNVNGNATYTPNTLNQYSAVSGTTITNNGNHQIGSYRNVTYTYMNDGQLVQAQGGSNTYQFLYDALGRCVKRSINGTIKYYIYDGDKPMLEYDAAGALAARNVYGKGVDELLMRTDYTFNPTAMFYYQHDHEGSATHLTNGSGDVIERYRYDVFGAPTIYPPQPGATPIPFSAVSNRFLFTGREYAAALGFYEYRARAYHPGLGRFMSEDPKLFDAGDYNLYRYCHNDPIDFTDPMGLGIDNPPPSPAQWAQSLMKQLQQLQAQARDLAERAQSTSEMEHSYLGSARLQQGWQNYRQGLTLAQMQMQRVANSNPRAPASIRRWIFPGPRVDRGEHGGYIVGVAWSLQLLDEHQKPTFGEGIRVDEKIEHSDAINFASLRTLTGPGWTKEHGVVSDPWTLGFKGPNGAVTTRQTIMVLGHETQWNARVSLIGGREVSVYPAELWAPLH
jgi:RHS repeat-associated protein